MSNVALRRPGAMLTRILAFAPWLAVAASVTLSASCGGAETAETPAAAAAPATTGDAEVAIEPRITVYAGSGEGGAESDGGPAKDASILSPTGLALDADGNLYISADNRVRKVDAETGIITTVVGTGRPGFKGDGGPAAEARLKAPAGLAVDSDGNLYIADRNNGRIRRVDGATGIISTVAGGGLPKRVGGVLDPGDGGLATDAWFKVTRDVAVDSQGNIYFTTVNRIRKVDAQTGIITTLAGTGSIDLSGDGGPSFGAGIAEPHGVAVDGDGNVYLADSLNQRIRRIDGATGIITTVAGIGKAPPYTQASDTHGKQPPTEGKGFSGDGGPAVEAMLSDPWDVAFGPDGNLYIADTGNDRIRKVDLDTGIITTFAEGGTIVGKQYAPDGWAGSGDFDISFKYFSPPVAVAVNKQGDLFIADQRLNKVVRIAH